jgi:hypothetical protein
VAKLDGLGIGDGANNRRQVAYVYQTQVVVRRWAICFCFLMLHFDEWQTRMLLIWSNGKI